MWFRGDIVRRNQMLVTLIGVKGLMIVSSADWSLQCCFRAFLDPLLNLRFISDFLVQSSKARAIFQHVWRIQLAFINV